MRIKERRPEPRGENVVPLINIVFLLLMFFLLAGTLAPRPVFDMEAVRSQALPPADAPAAALYVSAEGRLSYRGGEIALEGLAATVRDDADRRGEEALEVVLDRRLPADRLFPVVEALSEAGIGQVRLVTERAGGR